MCGIAGVFDTRDRRTPDRGVLESMNHAILHRGPDACGYHEEPGVGFAHRRLSIIDLSGGSQPLYNEDRSVVLIYNGEIYNFQLLVDELVSLGHTFHTRCDTEVVVHGWEQWGERCVDRFRGMFAFALWDRNTETLFLARDRLGVKPLYYAALPDGALLFGSELKALLCHPGLSRTLDPLAIEDYFAYGYVPEPRTILTQVKKLPPGHTLTVRRGSPVPDPRPFWDVPFRPNGIRSVEEAGEELIVRLREAVRIRLIAEVPLGAFLSGGVDSSAVVALMAGLSSEPVNTCTMAFGEREFNESSFAEQVAKRYGTSHRVETVSPDSFDLVDRLGDLYDEPFADSSAIPTYRVCGLARQRVTVALSGDGGDENLAGYRRYRWHLYEDRVRSLVPAAIRRPVFGLLGALYPKADWAPKFLRAKTTFQGIARDSVDGYFHGVSIMSDDQRQRLYRESFRKELQGYNAKEVLRRHARKAPTSDPLSLVQYLDIKTYLAGDILTKVDRASMAHSLEVRVPLLDHPLVEWISGLPPSMKLHGHEGKYVFKRALKPYLPEDLLYRPKMGFAVPLTRWFRGPLRQHVRDAVLGDAMKELGYFDLSYIESMVDQHQAGARDHSASLWSLMMFESSLQRLLGLRPRASAHGPGLGVRILHVLDHSIPLHSGYAFRTLAILREQRALGWETVHLTGPKQEGCHVPQEEVDGLRFYRTRARSGVLSSLPAVRELFQMSDLRARLESIARETKPDILHAHSPVLDALPALRVGRELGIPVVYEVRAFWEDAAVDHGTARASSVRYRLTRALESHALRRAAAVTTICEGLRGDIVARGIPGDRVTVIPNAVDVARFPGAEPSDPGLARDLGLTGARVLGFIGSFYHYEGLEVLLQALPAILTRMPDVRLLLVGGGPEDDRLRSQAQSMGLGERIRFVGRVPHDHVNRYYDLIDVLVYPRLRTRLTDLVTPLKPLEAMAQGRLLIASDVGGHRELIRDGETGVLFPAEDAPALAAAVVRLLESPDIWPALRSNARRFVETERSWPGSVERYRQVYASAQARCR